MLLSLIHIFMDFASAIWYNKEVQKEGFIVSRIIDVHAREVLDSRGNPTVEVEEMCIRDSAPIRD